MIQYDPRAARALGFLKRRFNDVEIYVEDTAGRNMWSRLIRALLPGSIKFDSVTMLGGRDAVEQACRLDQKIDGRRRLYIVDGDLDYLLGRPKRRLRHLYRLRACTVENLLADERNIIQVAIDSGGYIDAGTARQAVDFENVLKEYEQDLRALMVMYALSERLDVQGKLPRESIFLLMERAAGGEDRISKSKIYSKRRRLFAKLREQFVFERVKREWLMIDERQRGLSIEMVLPGKDYVLPLLWQKLKRVCNCKLTQDQFKVSLAREMLPSVEPYLARRLAAL